MFALATFSFGALSSTKASDPIGNAEKAAELVGQALQAEMDGDLLGRDRLLSEANNKSLNMLQLPHSVADPTLRVQTTLP